MIMSLLTSELRRFK